MASNAPTIRERVAEACHTAVSELGDRTPYEDLLDCVAGMMPVGEDLPAQWEKFALFRLHQLGVDISDECQGHEGGPDGQYNGPIGELGYCNGLCEARRTM